MKLMHSCKRAAELITLGFDEPLGMFDRILLRVHLSMCGSCRNVRTQLVSLEAMTGELFSGCAEEDGDDALVSPPSFRFKDSTPGGGSPGARP